MPEPEALTGRVASQPPRLGTFRSRQSFQAAFPLRLDTSKARDDRLAICVNDVRRTSRATAPHHQRGAQVGTVRSRSREYTQTLTTLF